MARLPKTPFRKTEHKPPKYQLYQVGFNPANTCWLEGSWITVPKAEYDKRKGAVDKEYARVRKQMKTQHYRDKGTAIKNLTRAQRIAYEHNSGSVLLEAMVKGHDGQDVLQPIRVGTDGNTPTSHSITWMRNRGYKVLRWVKVGAQGKPLNQLRGYKFPDDLVIENTAETAFDHVTAIVSQNRQRSSEIFEANLAALENSPSDVPGGEMMGMNFQQFSASMAVHALVEQEETIIRGEWEKSIGEDDTVIPFEPEKERALYVEMRNKLKVIDNWEAWYNQVKASHNECERANLDSSNGNLYCWVLPKFNDDGTHEPLGPRDVPWNHKPMRPSKPETAATAPN